MRSIKIQQYKYHWELSGWTRQLLIVNCWLSHYTAIKINTVHNTSSLPDKCTICTVYGRQQSLSLMNTCPSTPRRAPAIAANRDRNQWVVKKTIRPCITIVLSMDQQGPQFSVHSNSVNSEGILLNSAAHCGKLLLILQHIVSSKKINFPVQKISH